MPTRLLIPFVLALALAGCSTSETMRTADDGREYRETETRFVGVRVRLKVVPVQSEGEAAADAIRGPLKTVNRLSLFAGLAGLAVAVALKQYGLQEVGRIVAAAGGAVWLASGAILYALALVPWWVIGLAALVTAVGVALAYLSSGHGLDAWIAAKWRKMKGSK